MAQHDSVAHILESLVLNLVIAIGKGIAAFFTGSGALLAETLHTFADTSNQILLLLGVKSSRRPPTELHPLGHGRALYFWSFIVALLIFTGGGVFSLYEGFHKFMEPEPVHLVLVGVGILLFSLGLEGYATFSNVRELNKRRGSTPFLRFLRETKDSDLVVLFGENSAATLGNSLALVALCFAATTGDGRWDALGSVAIGIVLVGVAIFLSREVKSLLVGESADPQVASAVRETLPSFPHITRLLHLITVQQGPGQVIVMMKLGFQPELTIAAVCEVINRFEDKLRERCPEVRWCFIEPDQPRS